MDYPEHCIVTGASGYVGRSLATALGTRCEALAVSADDWEQRLARARWRDATVFHLAARVHAPGDDEAAFQRDNADKTEALVRSAASNGARRFVFLSSIKVNGEETAGAPFRAADAPRPVDAYGRSKWRAEQLVAQRAREGGLAYAIVRSPLVVGLGAKGNLAALLRLVDTPWPLPFASIDNRRTCVALDDLVELLLRCSLAPAAEGATFLAGNPDALSTPRLVTVLRRALQRPARLFPAPAALLETVAGLVGQGSPMRRLTRSLEIDVGETMRVLGWSPRVAMDDALARMATSGRAAA